MTEQQDVENSSLDSEPTPRSETEMHEVQAPRKRKSPDKARHTGKAAAEDLVSDSQIANLPTMATQFMESDEERAEPTVPFILRVIPDDGNPSHGEIEDVQTHDKIKFVGLDWDRIDEFVRAQIKKRAAAKPVVEHPTVPASAEVEKAPNLARPPRIQTAQVNVSSVWVSRPNASGAARTFNQDEPMLIDIHFALGGEDVLALTAEESAYELKVYANPASGKSILLTRRTGKLVRGVAEYNVQIQATNPLAGFYRLFTIVILDPPIRGAGYREGPTIDVLTEHISPNQNRKEEMPEQIELASG